jgi:hypothetical protein
MDEVEATIRETEPSGVLRLRPTVIRNGRRTEMSYRITVIGGGSSTFTPQLMQKFMASEVLRGSTVV